MNDSFSPSFRRVVGLSVTWLSRKFEILKYGLLLMFPRLVNIGFFHTARAVVELMT